MLPQTAVYALRALGYMASQSKDKRVLVADISEKTRQRQLYLPGADNYISRSVL